MRSFEAQRECTNTAVKSSCIRQINVEIPRLRASFYISNYALETYIYLCLSTARTGLCERENMVPAAARDSHDVGPGSNHHVQTSPVDGGAEHGGRIRWEHVSRKAYTTLPLNISFFFIRYVPRLLFITLLI
jgi:hypothetical protein